MADLFPSPTPVSMITSAPNGGFNENFQQQESLPPFNITESRLEGAPCGLGFLCDEDRMASCASIRALAISYGFGDVHAGMSCPENVTTYQNCPLGFYCPSPVCILFNILVCCVFVFLQANHHFSRVLIFDISLLLQEVVLPCPEGMFCPHKVSLGFRFACLFR
jgi:hypothetical protein